MQVGRFWLFQIRVILSSRFRTIVLTVQRQDAKLLDTLPWYKPDNPMTNPLQVPVYCRCLAVR